MECLRIIDLEGTTPKERDGYKTRCTARGVVRDSEGLVGFLYVEKGGYHKLPGGGIEEGEDYETAFQRECAEELGCAVSVSATLGMIIEYKKEEGVRQESFSFLADVVGDKSDPAFTVSEQTAGFQIVWKPLDEALQIFMEEAATSRNPYVPEREKTILEAVVKYLTHE